MAPKAEPWGAPFMTARKMEVTPAVLQVGSSAFEILNKNCRQVQEQSNAEIQQRLFCAASQSLTEEGLELLLISLLGGSGPESPTPSIRSLAV